MSVRSGFDLGTTFSAASWYDAANDRVETFDLEAGGGQRIMRSVVLFPGEGKDPVVGDTAWNIAKTSPERVVRAIKRRMGTDFRTEPIDGVTYSPTEVSAEILKRLASEASASLGERVEEVVITVPAYFGDTERAATEEAAKLAGLKVLRLLPEPHAAALAYAVDMALDIVDRHFLVFDLGGGTFDVVLVHVTTSEEADNARKLKLKTLCKAGDKELGGIDWDRALAEIVAEKVLQQFGEDIDPDGVELLEQCEEAKKAFRVPDLDSVSIIAGSHQVKVSRAEFEERTSDLIFTTQTHLEQVLEDAEKDHGVKKEQIEVLLAGGSSRLSAAQRMIEKVMGKPPVKHKNPDLLVTIGAAYWAHLLDGQAVTTRKQDDGGVVVETEIRVESTGIVDTGFPAGIQARRSDGQGGMKAVVANVIPDGTENGKTIKKTFATEHDNQTEIHIIVYEGDSESLDECREMATFKITGLPEGRPAGRAIDVELGYDGSGILRGEAVDRESGQRVEIEVNRNDIRV